MSRFACGLFVAQFIILAAAGADTLSVVADRDSTLFEDDQGQLAGGKNGHVFVGLTRNGERRRALFGFDLSAIASGARVVSVELSVGVDQQSRNIDANASGATLHRVSRDWSEGVSAGAGGRGETAQTGDTTWLHARFDDQRWQTPGGDFAATASASAAFPAQIDAAGATLTFGPTVALTADVQAWVDDPSGNFGWLLRGDETATSGRRLLSRENSLDGAPTLRIEFIPEQIFRDDFDPGG